MTHALLRIDADWKIRRIVRILMVHEHQKLRGYTPQIRGRSYLKAKRSKIASVKILKVSSKNFY